MKLYQRAWLVAMLFFFNFSFAQLENANLNTHSGAIFNFDLNGLKTITGTYRGGFSDACATSISDAEGNLLFYFNSTQGYYRPKNQLWQQLQPISRNGLYNFQSIILPVPLKKLFVRYDITTSNTFSSGYALNRYTLDTSKAFPEYDSFAFYKSFDDTTGKYFQFHTYKSDSYFGTAIGSNNCNGIWLMGLEGSGNMFAIKVDSNYKTNPIIYKRLIDVNKIGLDYDAAYDLTISPDGKKLAFNTYEYLYLYDFDAINATVTFNKKFDLTKLETNAALSGFAKYGLVFSRSGLYLYLTSTFTLGRNDVKVSQLDVNTGIFTKITDKRFWSGKMAIDGKIYLADNTKKISVIHKPELPCPACDYREDEIEIQTTETMFEFRAFPKTVENYYGRKYNFKISQTCIGDSVLFEGPKLAPDDKYIWHFADGFTSTAPGIKRHINQEQKIHLRYNYCDVYDTAQVPPPKPKRINDTILCAKNTLVLPTQTGVTFAINNKTFTGVVNVTNGLNYAQLSNPCFIIKDTFNVEIIKKNLTKPFGSDTLICHQSEITLLAKVPEASTKIAWNTGSTEPSIKISENGTYSLVRKNQCFSDTSSINVTFINPTDITKISNVFTPNGDGKNDTWQPITENITDYELQIYNRWGSVVQRTTEWNVPWNASDVPDGIYYYHIFFTDCNKTTKNLKGWVEVVR